MDADAIIEAALADGIPLWLVREWFDSEECQATKARLTESAEPA